jgi:hypothetical protein
MNRELRVLNMAEAQLFRRTLAPKNKHFQCLLLQIATTSYNHDRNFSLMFNLHLLILRHSIALRRGVALILAPFDALSLSLSLVDDHLVPSLHVDSISSIWRVESKL